VNTAKHWPVETYCLKPWSPVNTEFCTVQPLPSLRTNVETYLLAQHSDGPGITMLIHNYDPSTSFFVHGSPTYLADLTSLEELQNRYLCIPPLLAH